MLQMLIMITINKTFQICQVVIDKLMDLENFNRDTRSTDPPLDYWDVAYHPFSKRFHPHTKRDEGYGWKRDEHVLDEHQDQENELPQFLRVMRYQINSLKI